MHKFFVMLFAAASIIAFFSPAQAGQGSGTCEVSVQCDAYHAGGTGLKPAVANMVCFNFTQKREDFVLFTLYDVMANAQNLSDPANHILRGPIKHDVKDGTSGQFCVGRQWVEQSVFVVLCNQEDAHSYRDQSELQKGLESGKVEMCLNGDSTCAHFIR